MRGMRYGRECRAIAQPGPLGGLFSAKSPLPVGSIDYAGSAMPRKSGAKLRPLRMEPGSWECLRRRLALTSPSAPQRSRYPNRTAPSPLGMRWRSTASTACVGLPLTLPRGTYPDAPARVPVRIGLRRRPGGICVRGVGAAGQPHPRLALVLSVLIPPVLWLLVRPLPRARGSRTP
jgi:hypothetical protein